jgi:DNA repair protein RecO (recombination protein O)
LLALPGFLIGEGETGKEAVLAGLRLTGHFLGEHVWLARQIEPPQTRDRLISALL